MARQGPARVALAVQERAKQSGAELGRQRILALLADGDVHGVDYVADECHMSVRTCMQRLKELEDQVEVRRQVHGCPLVRRR